MTATTRASWNELRDAIADRNLIGALALIQNDPELINKTNGIGETVLHFLAADNDALGVVWLHDRGADINCENDFGIPAWFVMTQLGYQ